VMAALFLGGWDLPFLQRDGIHVAIGDTVLWTQALAHPLVVLIGFLGFIFKVLFMCWLQLSIRWTLPRFRYDQVMRLGWRVLLPISLGNVLVTGLLILVAGSASDSLKHALVVAGHLTKAAIAVGGVVAFIALVRFLLSAPNHLRFVGSSSARYAVSAGGTRDAQMGA
jgi:NADH-quinone oxidoreductase subunit H